MLPDGKFALQAVPVVCMLSEVLRLLGDLAAINLVQ